MDVKRLGTSAAAMVVVPFVPSAIVTSPVVDENVTVLVLLMAGDELDPF